MKWHKIPLDEQETLINFDYYGKAVILWSSRGIVCNKLIKKIGDPDVINRMNGLPCDAEWKIPFKDRKKIIKVLAIGILLMVKRKEED